MIDEDEGNWNNKRKEEEIRWFKLQKECSEITCVKIPQLRKYVTFLNNRSKLIISSTSILDIRRAIVLLLKNS